MNKQTNINQYIECGSSATKMEKQFEEQVVSETKDGLRFVRTNGCKISKWQLLVEYLQLIVKIHLIIIASIFNFFFPRRDMSWEKEIVLITGGAGYVGRNLAEKIAKKGNDFL